MLRVSRGISAAIVASCLTLALSPSEAVALRPSKVISTDPGKFGYAYRDVAFYTPDSVLLRGWLLTPPDSAQSITGPVVIIAGTDALNRSQYFYYAGMLVSEGYHVLMFDYRGFGDSSPFAMNPIELVYPEFIDDVRGAIAFVKRLGAGSIGIWGLSMGATLSLAAAAGDDNVKGMICEGIYTRRSEVVKNMKKADPESKIKTEVDYPRSYEPEKAVEKLSPQTAVLFVSCSNDLITTPKMAWELYEKTPGPREFYAVADASHGQAAVIAPKEYRSVCMGFFNRVLR